MEKEIMFTNDDINQAVQNEKNIVEENVSETIKAENVEVKARGLNATDIYPMARIISKIGINEFAKCIESEAVLSAITTLGTTKTKDAEFIAGVGVALEIANVIFGNLARCEKDISKFVGSIYGLKIEEVESLDPAVYLEMIIDIIQDEKFMDFIKVASKLFKQGK